MTIKTFDEFLAEAKGADTPDVLNSDFPKGDQGKDTEANKVNAFQHAHDAAHGNKADNLDPSINEDKDGKKEPESDDDKKGEDDKDGKKSDDDNDDDDLNESNRLIENKKLNENYSNDVYAKNKGKKAGESFEDIGADQDTSGTIIYNKSGEILVAYKGTKGLEFMLIDKAHNFDTYIKLSDAEQKALKKFL